MTANVMLLPDERAIVRGLSEGSMEALAALYDRLVPVVYPLALHILGSRELAACVIEDLFEEVWRDRAQLSRAGSVPAASLISRCRELALAQSGKGGGAAATPPDGVAGSEALGITGFSGEVGGAKVGGTGDTRRAAREALEALPEQDRRALKEAYFQGTSAHDIAILLGTPTSDAEAMLRRALVRLAGRGAPP